MAIYGCGGHARSIIDALYEMDENMEIILVDEEAKRNEVIMGCKVEQRYELKECDGYIIAIGDNKKRKALFDGFGDRDIGYCISVVSISSRIGREAKIGRGTFVAPNAHIGPLASIGENAIINTGSIIEHEAKVGNSTHIAPQATVCGRTVIGDNVLCGAGSIIKDKINICSNVVIGAGAVVIKDINEPGIYAGVPAIKIK